MAIALDESAEAVKLAETVKEVREKTGAFIDSWPDRFDRSCLRRAVGNWRKSKSPPPEPESVRAVLLGEKA